MMKKKNKSRQTNRRMVKTGPCYFCETKTEPDYLNSEELSQFVTDRAKIVSNDFSGLCSKHQRKLSIAVKRARHLALLPFTAGI